MMQKKLRTKIIDLFIPLKGRPGSNQSKIKFTNEFLIFWKKELDTGNHHKITHEFKMWASVTFFFTGEYKGDIDNLLKALFDALQESEIIKNDNQIKRVDAEIKENNFMDGIALEIRKYES